MPAAAPGRTPIPMQWQRSRSPCTVRPRLTGTRAVTSGPSRSAIALGWLDVIHRRIGSLVVPNTYLQVSPGISRYPSRPEGSRCLRTPADRPLRANSERRTSTKLLQGRIYAPQLACFLRQAPMGFLTTSPVLARADFFFGNPVGISYTTQPYRFGRRASSACRASRAACRHMHVVADWIALGRFARHAGWIPG